MEIPLSASLGYEMFLPETKKEREWKNHIFVISYPFPLI